jgi:hypothetical protein
MLTVVALATAIATAQGQRPYRSASMSGGSPVVSPAVVATFFTSAEPSGAAHQLDLLVLWRGAPGWFMRGGSKGGASSMSGGGGDAGGRIVHQFSEGGLSFSLEFDRQARLAKIQGREIAVGEDNVILVDDVDNPRGFTIVGTRRIDPAFSGSLKDLRTLFKRSPELVAYLRCDTQVNDARTQQMMDYICASYVQ